MNAAQIAQQIAMLAELIAQAAAAVANLAEGHGVAITPEEIAAKARGYQEANGRMQAAAEAAEDARFATARPVGELASGNK